MQIIKILPFFILFPFFTKAQDATVTENVIVYKEKDRYAGWPANYGIWSWGNEIVTGFFLGYHDDNSKSSHPIVKSSPQVIRQARSTDGGRTWSIERPSYLDNNDKEKEPATLTTPINFNEPGFAFLVRFEKANSGFSCFYYSYDRCKTWKGPYKLPDFGRKAIMGRTDYIVNSGKEMQLFLTAAKDDGREGWPFAARTTDGGKTWKMDGWIGKQPSDSGFAIMTSTLRLKNKSLFTMVRMSGKWQDGKKHLWMEPYLSADDGKSWYKLSEGFTDNNGNPPHMVRLKDGRIALTYGCREAPYGIRARISNDEGMSWGKEFILRNDGNNWDIGYVRSTQRADGKLVTVYYFNAGDAKERHISATIWDPGVAEK